MAATEAQIRALRKARAAMKRKRLAAKRAGVRLTRRSRNGASNGNGQPILFVELEAIKGIAQILEGLPESSRQAVFNYVHRALN